MKLRETLPSDQGITIAGSPHLHLSNLPVQYEHSTKDRMPIEHNVATRCSF